MRSGGYDQPKRSLCAQVNDARRANLSRDMRRRLVRYRRNEWRAARQTRLVTARLPLDLRRAAYVRFSGFDAAPGPAHDPDCRIMRMRLRAEPNRRRDCRAQIAALPSIAAITARDGRDCQSSAGGGLAGA